MNATRTPSKEAAMRIQRVKIQNILGIESLEFEPGGLTVVSGKNGRGKTSVLEAVKSLVEGGHDATLLRQGAESGEVVLVLDDGTELTKRVTPNGSTLRADHPTYGKIGAPKSFLDGLTDALSVNPVSLITAEPRKRAEAVLEALPLTVTPEQLSAATGPHYEATQDDAQGHALEAIERVRKALYDERTGVNRAAKEKRGTITSLSESLPESVEDVEPDEVAQWEAERDRLGGAWDEHLRAHADRVRERIAAAGGEFEEEEEALYAEMEKLRARLGALGERRAEAVADIEKQARDALAEVKEESNTEMGRVRESLATAREREKSRAERENTRRIVADMATQTTELEEASTGLTGALDRLANLRTSLLSELPIEGIAFQDGDVTKDGVPFARLNHAVQVEIAVEIARLRAGRLGLVCVDGLESLDRETFAAFRERADKGDVQMIVTQVSDNNLEVTS